MRNIFRIDTRITNLMIKKYMQIVQSMNEIINHERKYLNELFLRIFELFNVRNKFQLRTN